MKSDKKNLIKAQLCIQHAYYIGIYYWILVLTDIRTKKVRSFWLGQDIKFISRVLGWNYEDFINACVAETKSKNYHDKRVQRWILKQIVNGITNNSPEKLKDIFENAESWSLSAE